MELVEEKVIPLKEPDFELNNQNRITYSVEEAFDKIDKPFIDFYGEYGRRIVNSRREEWNKAGNWNFKTF